MTFNKDVKASLLNRWCWGDWICTHRIKVEVKDQGASMVPEPGALLLCLHSVKEARDFSGASESDNSIQGKVPMMETIPKG